MRKWEYRHYEISSRGFVNLKLPPDEFKELFQDSSAAVSRTEEEKHLREKNIVHYVTLMKALGAKGWELVCVVEEERGKKEMFFKRLLEEAPAGQG